MKKASLVTVILLLGFSCDKEETGTCTVSCGGFGTGQPLFWKSYPFKTESACKKLGEDEDKSSGNACKASYCPPTGNSNDCFQVYP
ncbi:MAG: hypothetical protein KIT62_15925 [Cyclobacteriaceae bacterium]|nr:hypothetical protein [Cyclobacteriaceae bacterium]